MNNKYLDRDFTPLDRIIIQPRIIIHYVFQMLLPFVGFFHLIYDFDWLNAPCQIWTYFSFIIIIVFGLLSCKLRKINPLVSFLIVFFLANHAIESGVIGIQLAFEHRNYLPSISIYLSLMLLFSKLVERKRIFISIFLIFLAFNCINTFILNKKYSINNANAIYDYRKTYTANSYYNYLSAFFTLTESKDFRSAQKISDMEYFCQTNNRRRLQIYSSVSNVNTDFIIGNFAVNVIPYIDNHAQLKIKIENEIINDYSILRIKYKYIHIFMQAYFNLLDLQFGKINTSEAFNNITSMNDENSTSQMFNLIHDKSDSLFNNGLLKIRSYDKDKLNKNEAHLFGKYLLRSGSLLDGIVYEKLAIEKGYEPTIPNQNIELAYKELANTKIKK